MRAIDIMRVSAKLAVNSHQPNANGFLLTGIGCGITFYCGNTETVMATRVTVKGQVTLPKRVREAAGIRPGDRVEVRATAAGAVLIEKKPDALAEYEARLRALMARRPIRRVTTDQLMEESRGEIKGQPRGRR
jgi:antitoxin PrlF